ncbi:hypothetical protein ABFX02_04G102200 [Erythranthe guttata]
MSPTKHSDEPPAGEPLLSESQSSYSQTPQYVVVLPAYLPPYRHRLLRKLHRRRLICFSAVFLFLISAAYVVWPSDPELSVVRMSLNRLHFHTRPKISLDVTLDLRLKVRNRDVYSMYYDSLLVAVGYRGESLGNITSEGGHIRARGSSYVNATLDVDGVEMLSDVILLLEDLAAGSITFDTVSEIGGKLGLFFFELPLKAKISCEVIVNTRNSTITRQNCYPEI